MSAPDGRSAPETAGQAHVGRAWDEWYAENGRDRTMTLGFAESKYDAMRRAFHAGAIAAAAPAPAPSGEAPEMRAVIDMIWRMCQKPAETAGTTQGVVVNGERLAARIAGLIKNSGMEPF